MTHEPPSPISPHDVPLGYEPLIWCGDDRPFAEQVLADNAAAGKDTILVEDIRGLEVWYRTHRDWPFV